MKQENIITGRSPPWSTAAGQRMAGAFTLIEVLVAVGITALLAGLAVTVVITVSRFWSRTSGRLSTTAQARYVLDQLALDLQGARFRDDGGTWLAATILTDTGNAGALWDMSDTTANATKPSHAAGSLQAIASGGMSDSGPTGPRFGVAGTWLRFITTRRGGRPGGVVTPSAPVAVGYQIVRRAVTATPGQGDRRYLLHRVEVRPTATSDGGGGTLQAGFDVTAAAYQPSPGSAQPGDPAEIRYPTLHSVLAENVIDFGVRLYVRTSPSGTNAGRLVQIFPVADDDVLHLASLPVGVANAGGDLGNSFPDVADIMIRVLTDEGARMIANFEASPPRIATPEGRTAAQFWWDLAVAHSHVYTRRIEVRAAGF